MSLVKTSAESSALTPDAAQRPVSMFCQKVQPTLTAEEIAVVERYYHDHQQELDEEDGQIRARSAERKNPAWVEKMLEEARGERLAITERLRQYVAFARTLNQLTGGDGKIANGPNFSLDFSLPLGHK